MRNSKQVYRVRSLGGNYDLFGMIATVCDQNEQPDMRPVLMINHDFCDHASEMRDPELVSIEEVFRFSSSSLFSNNVTLVYAEGEVVV